MRSATSNLLLWRRGLLFLPATRSDREGRAKPEHVEALMLDLAALGYACTPRLRSGLAQLSTPQLAELREQTVAFLAAKLGQSERHLPLFRHFPRGVPRDTAALWFRRVLVHFIQAPDQPCLWCDGEGNTHVLRPCEHVVCDVCFDGSNYSACPICNRVVDRSSPFFKPSELRSRPKETVRFKRLELGEDLDASARAQFQDFCARTQALNPDDKLDFTTLLDDYQLEVLGWVPEKVPLRENVALVFGRLIMHAPAEQVLPVAREHLRTATDVLRLIATVSGADAALQGAIIYDYEELRYVDAPWWPAWSASVGAAISSRYRDTTYRVAKPRTVKRFPVAKLARATRRALLSILDGLDENALIEDMLRHRSYWVWVGEFLHPGEYAKRFPKVARAFRIVRKRNPEGERAETFHGFYARLELAAAAGDSQTMLELLRMRPGELARRFDHLLRVAGDEAAAVARIVEGFVAHVDAFSTPVLLTLYGVLPTRAKRAKRRMFWPKGGVSKGVTTSDRRPTLPASVIEAARRPIERELLRRFATQPRFPTAVVDEALRDIIAPFNERTASPSAVNLPRGSKIHVPPGKLVRMFLHWCEREGGERTDVDLSVGFYDADWEFFGVCSYYSLRFEIGGVTIATSSGDLTS
ncbi:MAG TPA: MXAN_6230/SCO0854 family RING domain-containing protein, partial [Enhygromyxa sp.]|nr:MXAN_6230/SCO0854 family RING domain-containing protein [Enhygromyxa sp.]